MSYIRDLTVHACVWCGVCVFICGKTKHMPSSQQEWPSYTFIYFILGIKLTSCMCIILGFIQWLLLYVPAEYHCMHWLMWVNWLFLPAAWSCKSCLRPPGSIVVIYCLNIAQNITHTLVKMTYIIYHRAEYGQILTGNVERLLSYSSMIW